MSCQEIQNRLLLFHKNELAPDIVKEINQHLQRCEGCAAALQELQEVDLFLKENLKAVSAPAIPQFKSKKSAWKYIAAIAATIILIPVILMIFPKDTYQTENNIFWQESTLMGLEYDYYRIRSYHSDYYQYKSNNSSDDVITNSIYDLNQRIDYLVDTQL
jgi:hypothetical protein